MDWSEEEVATPVAITHFDFSTFDSLESQALEALQKGEFGTFLRHLKSSVELQARLETIEQLDGMASHFRSRYMGYDLIRDVCGLATLEGESCVTLARRHGISKAAWQENRERMRRILGLRKTATMRNDQARQHMRERNYRR